MQRFVITGENELHGDVEISGAKNVALKVLVTALLTDETIVIHNIPLLRDVFFMLDVLKSLGIEHTLKGHSVTLRNTGLQSSLVPLEVGARLRTSSMVVGPLLARYGKATIPNPGGCRLGARPIDRHIDGLKLMGADISYKSDDGFFYATAGSLHGATITFPKNTHTGTETLLLAAVLAKGVTVLKNAAEEIEVDELITLLNAMGADIVRSGNREITIKGVEELHGAEYHVMSDRNEEVTYAIAAAITNGSITVHNSAPQRITAFLELYTKAGLSHEIINETTTRYFRTGPVLPTDVVTTIHPGFMTDWQAPWAVLMTQAEGISTIHETVFESRFSYAEELKKMGAKINFFDPPVDNPQEFYNFNWDDHIEGYKQAIRIQGKTVLHNAIVSINDLRAGATLILAALIAQGESSIHGIEQVDRGYEEIEIRLQKLGANITRIKEEE